MPELPYTPKKSMVSHVIGLFGGLVKRDHASMAWMSQGFDSLILHQWRDGRVVECTGLENRQRGNSFLSSNLSLSANVGGVAQLVRASACHAEGRGFESLHSRHPRSLRLSVRTRGFHPRKRGSIPLGTANKIVPVVQLDRIRVS